MHTIDVHTHVVPRGLPFGHDERFAALHADGGTAHVLVNGKRFRTIDRRSWDVAARLADMDDERVQMQVLSVMPELFSYWAEPALGSAFCRALNEAIATCVAVDPRRFVGLGVVPLQDLDRAIGALQHVRDLGLRGAAIGSNVNGVNSGDRRFLPFFQAAADMDLCVFVHAFHPPYEDCIADLPVSTAVNFPPEIGTCMATVIANGIIEQSPGLRLGASHGGGTLLAHLPRMAAFWDVNNERAHRSPSPYDAVRSLWFDSLVYAPAAFDALLDGVGPSQIMVGSDYPFFDRPSGYLLDDREQRHAALPEIRASNALVFLGLAPPAEQTTKEIAR